jgi:hypothetical protein
MPYRDASAPPEEILERIGILTKEGAGLVGFLGAFALIALVALGVSVFGGMPPGLRPWLWTMPAAAVLFGAPAVLLHRSRRRELQVLRIGSSVRLVVPGATALELPVFLSGNQVAIEMNGVTMHHFFLKLVDGRGTGLLFKEVRGMIHGPIQGWFANVDGTAVAASYEVRSKGDLVRIRALVESYNAEVRGSAA